MAASGAGLLVSASYFGLAWAQPRQTGVTPQNVYRGRKVVVERSQGRTVLVIDGERLVTVDSGGAYRAAGFAFAPEPTLQLLAEGIIDYRIGLRG